MPIHNLIFDWSGTLADDLTPVVQATNEIFKHYGQQPWSEEEFREKFYLPFPEFYKQYLPEAELVELEFQYRRAFNSLQDHISLLPYAMKLLQFAKEQGMKIFLLSTIHPEHWNKQAGDLSVRDFFTHPYAGVIDKRKTILTLLAEHDLEPRETMFIGDMEHDIETAHHAGVISCAVLTGYNSLEKLKRCEPELLFRNLGGVLGYLQRHQKTVPGLPVPTVGALIYNSEGKVLMVRTHKWSNLWGIPGGKIKYGETAEEALHREVQEETGLQLTDSRHVMTQDCIECEEFYRPAHFLLLNYVAKTDGKKVQLNEEAEEFCWILPEEALSTLQLNTPTQILIKQTLSNTSG